MASLRLLDANGAGRPGEDLERKLHRMIVGKDEALHHIVRAYQCHLTGLAAAGRPIANLLFLGPTGTGKTRVVAADAPSQRLRVAYSAGGQCCLREFRNYRRQPPPKDTQGPPERDSDLRHRALPRRSGGYLHRE